MTSQSVPSRAPENLHRGSLSNSPCPPSTHPLPPLPRCEQQIEASLYEETQLPQGKEKMGCCDIWDFSEKSGWALSCPTVKHISCQAFSTLAKLSVSVHLLHFEIKTISHWR